MKDPSVVGKDEPAPSRSAACQNDEAANGPVRSPAVDSGSRPYSLDNRHDPSRMGDEGWSVLGDGEYPRWYRVLSLGMSSQMKLDGPLLSASPGLRAEIGASRCRRLSVVTRVGLEAPIDR